MTPEVTDALAVLVVAGLGYLTTLARSWVKAHTSPQNFATIASLASQAVVASEELARGTDIPNDVKFSVAADALTASAKRLGIKLSEDEVQSFLNAAVAQVKAVDRETT